MAKATPLYELMYIINPVLNDGQTKDIAQRVTSFIRDQGGDIDNVTEIGSQRLAYPIEKKRNGYYVNLNFRHEDGGFVEQLRRTLHINDDIMRHLVLRYDAKMERHYHQQRAEAARQPADEQPAEAA